MGDSPQKKNEGSTQDLPLELIEPEKTVDQKEILKNLNGRTLMIYFVLLNIKKTGVRELQRNLDLSSPSVARYHLDKLTDLHLVENRNGEYFLINKAKIPALTSWILLGNQLIPRAIFAATLFSLLFMGYFIFIFSLWHKDSVFLLICGVLLCSYLWFDVWWHYRNKPF